MSIFNLGNFKVGGGGVQLLTQEDRMMSNCNKKEEPPTEATVSSDGHWTPVSAVRRSDKAGFLTQKKWWKSMRIAKAIAK